MIGGGIRNQVLCQTLADVLAIPIDRLESGEFATSLGAAVCAGVGVGLFDDFSVAATLCPVAGTDRPNPEAAKRYDKLYPLFCEAYDALTDLYGRLADFQSEIT
jgi:xylulokinase